MKFLKTVPQLLILAAFMVFLMGCSGESNKTDTTDTTDTSPPDNDDYDSSTDDSDSPGDDSNGTGDNNSDALNNDDSADTGNVNSDIKYETDEQFTLLWRDDFETFDSSRWSRANHSFAENEANFIHDNVIIEDGILKLIVSIAEDGSKPYYGGEIRTHEFFTYGRFETRAKFAAGSGLISSLFTFYDHYADAEMEENWNEIDIEFLGSKSNEIQYNEIVWNEQNNKVMNEFHDILDYNPSDEFRVYAFEWTPSGVSFYIDGELRHSSSTYASLMFRPQRLMMNIWPTNLTSWAGPIDDSALPAVAEYDWVAYYEYNEEN